MKKSEKIFEIIQNSLQILGLPECISIKEVKSRYRELSKKNHPDKHLGNDLKMAEINEAYKTVINFLENFTFDLSEEGKRNITQDELWERKFGVEYLFEGVRGKKRRESKSL